MLPRPPTSTLFPYTTLFRSSSQITGPEAGTTSAPDPFLAAGRLGREAARAHAADLFARHVRMVEGLCRGLLRSEEHTSELQSQFHLVCRLLLEKKKNKTARL